MDARTREEMKEFAASADYSCGVFGAGGEFLLVPVHEPGPVPTEEIQSRGFHFCGWLTIRDGDPGAWCEQDPDSRFTCLIAAFAFAQRVADKIKPNQQGDFVQWLQHLWELPDERA